MVSHNRWPARFAAIEGLRSYRSVEAVGPLVNRLQTEEHQRLRSAIGATLHVITGVQLYDDPQLWKLWWSENAEGFVMPEEPPKAAGQGSLVEVSEKSVAYRRQLRVMWLAILILS